MSALAISEKQWRVGGYGFMAIGVAVGFLYCLAYEQPILTLWSAVAVLAGTLLIMTHGGSNETVGLMHVTLGIVIGIIASATVSISFGVAWGFVGIMIGLYLLLFTQFSVDDLNHDSL